MNLLIGYSDFIRLLNVNDPRTFIPDREVRFDGVYVIPPAPSILLTPHERATLSEHPTSDLSKPALPFPCTWKELEDFIDREGLRHKYTFPQFFTYRETFIALQSRYPDLTEAELRMWVTGKKGLVALTDEPGGTRRSRLKHPAFRFHWDGSQHANQSINALLDCWFPSVQVLRFIPIQRYLTYGQLVERWKSRVSGDIHQFIAERVSAYHKQPDYRGSLEFGAFDPLGRLNLPIEDYVFAMDQAEEKEQRWFVQSVTRPEPQLRSFQTEDVRLIPALDNIPQSTSASCPTKKKTRNTPFKEVVMLVYQILSDKESKPPTATDAFNYLLRGEYRDSTKGKEHDLSLWVKQCDYQTREVKLSSGNVLTLDKFTRTFKTVCTEMTLGDIKGQ